MPNRAVVHPESAPERAPRDGERDDIPPTDSDVDFGAVFESAPDSYLLLAPDPPRFTMLAANEARLRATMTRREDVIGHPLFDVFPDNPTDAEATGVRNLRASLDAVLRTGKPHRMALQKYDIRRADGEFEERYWEPLNSPVFDDHGTLRYIIHRVEDVTEQVRSGERVRSLETILDKLRESEERYRLLVDMIPQNIWTTDAEGRHTYFSRGWYEFSGAAPEDSHGEGWVQFIHPDDRNRTIAQWQHSLATGEPYEIEYRFRGSDGEYRWFLGQAKPLRNRSGEVVEWFGTATDITERKRLDEERDRLLSRERQAREEVTTILESITDAFFAVDREWRFIHVNREAERLMKRARAELLGRSLWEEFSGAVGSTFQHEYHRAIAEQRTVQFEAYAPTLQAWLEVRAYPSGDGLSVFFRDISARKHAEERLRESEARYRLLADMIPQHVWTTDPSGGHTYFSRRWYEFTGTTPEDSRGEGWLAQLHPDDRERTLARWQHSLRTGERYSIEYRFRSAKGDYCWFMGQAVPLRDDTGRIIEWFGTLTDITERKRLDAERERLLEGERDARADAERRREELERVTESRTRLMRGFSHDVKNPLGAADGYAALLEEGVGGALSEAQQKSVQRIRRSIQMSLRLINDLLELARAEAGQVELRIESLDASALAREVAEDFRGQINASGLELEVDVPEPLPVKSDATRVRQILSNLVSNAAKYTHRGRITVATSPGRGAGAPRPGEWVAIRVTDTGPGIPADKQQLIFQEFTRLDPHAPHGAGVGLAISHRIACLLGGDVTVESEVGRGSTFTLWLPPQPPSASGTSA